MDINQKIQKYIDEEASTTSYETQITKLYVDDYSKAIDSFMKMSKSLERGNGQAVLTNLDTEIETDFAPKALVLSKKAQEISQNLLDLINKARTKAADKKV